jgi:hypothetical protein
MKSAVALQKFLAAFLHVLLERLSKAIPVLDIRRVSSFIENVYKLSVFPGQCYPHHTLLNIFYLDLSLLVVLSPVRSFV